MLKCYTTVRVRIEAETREHLAMAAKVMQIDLIRVRELKRPGLKTGYIGTGKRILELK